MRADLARIVGSENVLPGDVREYLIDATQTTGFAGRADAVVLPGTAEEVAAVVAWCYEHDVPVTTRGGGTGYAGGAVPGEGIVLALDRLTRVRRFDPLLWRIHVEAGLRSADLRRIARTSGLFFPPDPGAIEQSQIGGNIATNAGGPHCFKYGATGKWVLGLEAVLPPGELVSLGGPLRKDVAGYDLKSLLVGSEGTLGVITAAWLRLVPAPESFLPVAAFYADTPAGCAAIERIFASGVEPTAVEYLDRGSIVATCGSFPAPVPEGAGFLVVTEADGSREEAERGAAALLEAVAEDALAVHAPVVPRDVDELWRWRSGVAYGVAAVRGGKVTEDVGVPLDRLADVIEATPEIGARHGLEACSLGHAGDGNVHSSFLVRTGDEDELRRAEAAMAELFDLAVSLGGTIAAEHGVGSLKTGWLERQLGPAAFRLHRAVKDLFDPKGLLNPGKKI